MTDADWKPTACILCYANCGVEVQTEGRRITRVRGDKAHVRSKGYLCQKAQALAHYPARSERLTSPLRRRADGTFEPISWDTAIGDIAARLGTIRDRHGPEALGYYGGGGQGNHSAGGYGIGLLRALGGRHIFSSLAQEKSGRFWVNGRMFGSQNCNQVPQVDEADLVILLGSNMWEAQCEPGARIHLREIGKDVARKMIVIDPVRTKDAEFADLHLQIKPGTDTFLLGAMVAMLVRDGAVDEAFLSEHTHGWADIRPAIEAIPIDAYIAKTGLDPADVEQAVAMITAANRMALRSELGMEMGRNSTLNSYLHNLLFLITGHFGRPGTQMIHSWLQPLFGNSRGAHSAVTGMEEIAGLYPPNRFPAEILNDHPDRLRAVIVDSSNPANSAADTRRVEAALDALDLLVVIDIAMTETAAKADYVLPAASQMEKWEFTYFAFSFPKNYFHVRAPIFDPLDGTWAEPEIYVALARALGLMPDDPALNELSELAATNRLGFAQAFGALIKDNPRFIPAAPLILHQTLGRALGGAASAAILWPGCHNTAKRHGDAVRRALGTDAEGPMLGEALFQAVLDGRHGTMFSHHLDDDVWDLLANPDGKIQLAVPEMLDWIRRLDPAPEAADEAFPFVVSLGQRRMFNANQIVRDPAWRREDELGGLRVHPEDLTDLGAADGDWITVTTATGALTARADADESLRKGYAVLPHGYGMAFTFKDGTRMHVGPRINLLSASDHCDPLAATPYHKNVPAALSRASNIEVDRCEAEARQLYAYLGRGAA